VGGLPRTHRRSVQDFDHDQAWVARPEVGNFLQRPKAHARVEPPGPLIVGIRLGQAKRLDLEQPHAVCQQIGFERLDQGPANAPPVQGGLYRHQVNLC
jgi:hypothetical protein